MTTYLVNWTGKDGRRLSMRVTSKDDAISAANGLHGAKMREISVQTGDGAEVYRVASSF